MSIAPKPEASTPKPEVQESPEKKEFEEVLKEALQITLELGFLDIDEDKEELKEVHKRARKVVRRFLRISKVMIS